MQFSDPVELKDIDPDDIGDVLLKVERSFGFRFGEYDLKEVKTFGELCDVIVGKVSGADAMDCTSQQSFYRLREAIAAVLGIEKRSITTGTLLESLFPRKGRRMQVKALEKKMGYPMRLLDAKGWIITSLFLMVLASLVMLFVNWKIGLPGFVVAVMGLTLAGYLGKEIDVKVATVGQLADKLSREHYKRSRRDPSTVNRKEIVQKLRALFIDELGLEEALLVRESSWG